MSLDPKASGADAEYDFIIVGSGAGGAPLAARLALAGKRVLVIEAGSDHSKNTPSAPVVEVAAVPSFHAISTEFPDLSWQFFVQHYDSPPPYGADSKWHPKPGQPDLDAARRGIFYPRAAAVGGCTVHNAMITIAGPDSDWDDLADFVRDDSWRAEVMRPYFQKLERNEYVPIPKAPPTQWWGRAWDNLWWLFGREPDYTRGRHGFHGWLRTSVADPQLVLKAKDWQLLKMIFAALLQAKHAGIERVSSWLRHLVTGTAARSLDPNNARTQAESPEGLALVPLAVCGKSTTPLHQRGHRSSPREFLLEVQASHPGNLTILPESFVTEILFDDGPPLRAVGVKVLKNAPRVYQADSKFNANPPPLSDAVAVKVRAGGEVILCGGSFNTPQLLMLSGIGPAKDLEKHGIKVRIDSPGVGLNLHDRYEVTVLSEMKHDFALLEGADFRLPNDPASPDGPLKEWREQGTGLYSSNGSVIGILKRSSPELAQPDLFIFGIPLPFEGYAVGYSNVHTEYPTNYRRLFTWAILKAHTRNRDGTVKLLSANPFVRPEINFHYFEETTRANQSQDERDLDPDLAALVDGVKFVRGIAKHASIKVKDEFRPGYHEVPDTDDECADPAMQRANEKKLRDWIRRSAWGHHATGTCRMGPDGDANAVLDSRFRVRGTANSQGIRAPIAGLRVVDASVFPKIPGYFIVTNIYVASEKAADTILADAECVSNAAICPDATVYPRNLRTEEAAALTARRKEVAKSPDSPELASISGAQEWPEDVTGLGLSGGGIRSATWNLGILQAMARARWLRRIDILSTVSGGGYIGSFIGRFFDRLREAPLVAGQRDSVYPGPARIEHEITDPDSREIEWLRKSGNYISPSGPGDARFNLAVFLRNLLSVHFVVGMLVFALFGLANALRYGLFDKGVVGFGAALSVGDLPLNYLLQQGLGAFWSPWFVLFELLILFLVMPRIVGYWIASQDENERYHWPSLALVFVMIAALLFITVQGGFRLAPFALVLSLLSAFIFVELAWYRGRTREAAVGTGGTATQRLRTRNYLTYDLGLALAVAGGALGFALIDTAGHALHEWLIAKNRSYATAFAQLGALVIALVPIARFVANALAGEKKPGGPPSTLGRIFKAQAMAGLLALVLFTVPLIIYAFASHAAFQGGVAFWTGVGATVLALIISGILAHPDALAFVNRSSLSQTYAARLARAYLGASNPLRHHPQGANLDEVMASDDVTSIRDYRPHEAGGPLHLLNVTVNQTVDFTSQRGNRSRKGENMAVSALGCTVGTGWHSFWSYPAEPAIRARGTGRVASVTADRIIITRSGGIAGPAAEVKDAPGDGTEVHLLKDYTRATLRTCSLPEPQVLHDYTAPGIHARGWSKALLPAPVVCVGQEVKRGDVLAVRADCTQVSRARALPVGRVAGTDHPLLDETGAPTNEAETLTLRQWMSISGAAVGPGRGQNTQLGTALLFGLANLRTGYWWDSGITESARNGFPKLTFLRRLLYLVPRVFLTQSLLIFEWIARYPGPWEQFWYISDGGFFENLGGYELIRRRVPRIILCDGGADPLYQFEDFANLVRKVRIDFDASIEDFNDNEVPEPLRDFLGTRIDDLRPGADGTSRKQAALFWVRYPDGPTGPTRRSLLLYVKASVRGNEPADIAYYRATHPEFPHEATGDQFFDEAQWESYRKLGEHLATPLFADPSWFWKLPLTPNPPAKNGGDTVAP